MGLNFGQISSPSVDPKIDRNNRCKLEHPHKDKWFSPPCRKFTEELDIDDSGNECCKLSVNSHGQFNSPLVIEGVLKNRREFYEMIKVHEEDEISEILFRRIFNLDVWNIILEKFWLPNHEKVETENDYKNKQDEFIKKIQKLLSFKIFHRYNSEDSYYNSVNSKNYVKWTFDRDHILDYCGCDVPDNWNRPLKLNGYKDFTEYLDKITIPIIIICINILSTNDYIIEKIEFFLKEAYSDPCL